MRNAIQLTLILVCFAMQVNGQNSPIYSQYIFNMQLINPAYTGSKGVLQTNALHRSQWSGIDGAPTTQTISVEGEFRDEVGLGGHLINDQVGSFRRTSAYGSYAYKVRLEGHKRINFGLSLGISQFSVDATRLSTDLPNDPTIANAKETMYMPDAKGGIFYHDQTFYAGISIGEVLGKLDFSGADLFIRNMEYFFTTGVTAELSPGLLFKPSILIKEDFSSQTNTDFNLFFLVSDQLWLGTSVRTGAWLGKERVDEIERMQINELALISELYFDNFRIGYAYGHNLKFKKYPTHEVSLGYIFDKDYKSKSKSASPRHF